VTVWELRQAIESAIPAWVLLIPLGLIVLAAVGLLVFGAWVEWLLGSWFK
jgi:hypothetical protein